MIPSDNLNKINSKTQNLRAVCWGIWSVKTQYLPTSFTRKLLQARNVTRC